MTAPLNIIFYIMIKYAIEIQTNCIHAYIGCNTWTSCINGELWRLLEAECHQLDIQLAMVAGGQSGDKDTFLTYSKTIRENQMLEEKERETNKVFQGT